MFRHEVPTHLDVQDRLAAGLTARQLALALAGLALAHATWTHLETWSWLPAPVRAALAGTVAAAFAAGALLRPQGAGLDRWAFALARHAARPRVCVWRPSGESRTPAFAGPGAEGRADQTAGGVSAGAGPLSDFDRAWAQLALGDAGSGHPGDLAAGDRAGGAED